MGAVDRVLRPLVRLAIAHGLKFRDLSEWLKIAYVSGAERWADAKGTRATDSRVAMLTGLQRKDIKAIRAQDRPAVRPPLAGPLPRLIRAWRNDAPFTLPDGGPAVLARSGDEASFEALAATISTDLHPRSLLDELVRLDLVAVTEDGVELLAEAYLPGQGEDASLSYLGANLGDHAETAVANVLGETDPLHFERAAHFNRLTPAALAEVEALARRLQQETLEKIAARAAALQKAGRGNPAATGRFRCGAYVYSVTDEEADG